MSFIADELRRARKELAQVNRRIALMDVEGKVAERDPKKWMVRVELDAGGDGKKVLSDWHKVQSVSAGKLKISALPNVGEPVRLRSPSGVIGPGSLVTFGPFDDEAKKPDQEADEAVIEHGKSRISVKDGEIQITVGGSEGFKVSGDGLQMLGKFKGKNGSRPAHYKGGKDTGGDIAMDGNDDVLI